MTDMGFLEANDERPKLRQAKPVRHLTAQHASFLFGAADLALAGDDKDESQPVTAGALQEGEQCVMGPDLRHTM